MNIVFIRHSKSLVNPSVPINTWGLSEEGVILAKKINKLEVIRTLDIVYSSLQPKALETSILATKDFGIPIKTDDRLTETSSFTNKFVGQEQLEKNTKAYYSDKDLSINGGETYNEALNRFTDALEEITMAESHKANVGIVSHGNILTAFSSQYTDKDVYKLAEDMKQPDIAVFNWNTKQFINSFGDIKV